MVKISNNHTITANLSLLHARFKKKMSGNFHSSHMTLSLKKSEDSKAITMTHVNVILGVLYIWFIE